MQWPIGDPNHKGGVPPGWGSDEPEIEGGGLPQMADLEAGREMWSYICHTPNKCLGNPPRKPEMALCGLHCGLIMKLREKCRFFNVIIADNGGEGGIRTHGTVARTSVFETDPFDRSGTSPALGEARLPSIDRAPIIGPALGRNLHR